MWVKKGLIFSDHHAQLPVVDVLADRIRIYYSTRYNGKSLPLYIDVDKQNPGIILDKCIEPLLHLGKAGYFDWSGVMPTSIVTFESVKYMYYIGWSQRLDVPYHNTLGLALSRDFGKTWQKYSEGPVFSTCAKEPGYIGTAEVKIINGEWHMWYLSCREWIEYNGKMEPVYDIKYAFSNDGINWTPTNETVIPLIGNEGGISAARLRESKGGYEIYFSVRNRTNYRENRGDSYRIKKSVSTDFKKWNRKLEVEIDTSHFGWDDFMTCYPAIAEFGQSLYLFYNGNGFGKTGIGYAEAHISVK